MPELPDFSMLPRIWEGHEKAAKGAVPDVGGEAPPTEDWSPTPRTMDRLAKQRELAAKAMNDPHYYDPVSQFWSKYASPFFKNVFAAGPQPLPVEQDAAERQPLVDHGHPVSQAYQSFRMDNAYARYQALQEKYGDTAEGRSKAGADPELQQLAEEIKWAWPTGSAGFIDESLRVGGSREGGGTDPGASFESAQGQFAEKLFRDFSVDEVKKQAEEARTEAEKGLPFAEQDWVTRFTGLFSGKPILPEEPGAEGGEPASMLEWAGKAKELQAKYPNTLEGRRQAMSDPELQLALIAGRGVVEDALTGFGGFYKGLFKAIESSKPLRREVSAARRIARLGRTAPGSAPSFDHLTLRGPGDEVLPEVPEPEHNFDYDTNPSANGLRLLRAQDKAMGGPGEVTAIRSRDTGGDILAWPAARGDHDALTQAVTGHTIEPGLTSPEAVGAETSAPNLKLAPPTEEQMLGGRGEENSGFEGNDRLTDTPLHEQRVAVHSVAGDVYDRQGVLQAEVFRQKMAADHAGISPQGAAAIAVQHPDDVNATYGALTAERAKDPPPASLASPEETTVARSQAALDILKSVAATPLALAWELASIPGAIWDSYKWLHDHPDAAWSDDPAAKATAYGHALNVAGAITLSEPFGVAQVPGSTTLGAGGIRTFHGSPHGWDKPDLAKAAPEATAPAPAPATSQTGRAITDYHLRDLPYQQALEVAQTQRHIIPGQEGQYVGAPRGMASPQKLSAMRRGYDKSVDAGVDGSKWYSIARGAINDVAGMEPARQSLLARQWALFSPQANVDANLGFQLAAHNAWLAGHPLDIAHTGAQARTFNTAMDTGTEIELGAKTGVFAHGLDPTMPPSTTGTNDIWQGRAFGYDAGEVDRAFTPQEHAFMDAETVLATDRANKRGAGGRSDWTPSETQAAAWVATKGRSDGEKFFASKKNTDPRTGARIASKEEAIFYATKQAARTYPDFFPKYTAFITEESVPYIQSGHMAGLQAAPEDVRKAYGDAASWRDIQGRDRLAGDLGMFVRSSGDAHGIYHPPGGAATEFNPMTVGRPMVGFSGPTGARTVDRSSGELLDSIGAVKGYMGVQGAVPWHLANAKNNMKNAPGYRVPMGRMVSHEEMAKLDELLGPHGLMPVHTGDGITVMPFEMGDPGPITRALKGGLAEQIEQVLPDARSGSYRAGISGGYPSFEDELTLERQGTGVATQKLFDIIDKNPEIVRRMDESPSIRDVARKQFDRDANIWKWEHGETGAAREDIQNARDIMMNSDRPLSALRDALKAGEIALPAVLLYAIYSAKSGDGT